MSFFQLLKKHKGISLAVVLLLLSVPFLIRGRIKKSHEGKLTPPIQRGDIVEGVYGIGTVMANKSFHLQTGVTNIVREIFVKEGEYVKKGAALINIGGNVSHAPFDGVITSLPIKVGEVVYMQSNILTLTDLKDRYLVVSLEQEGAIRVRPGQKARLNFESIRNLTYEGRVQSVYSQFNNFLARIDIGNLPKAILPGMTADVAIAIAEKHNVLLVPVNALDGNNVYVKGGLHPKKIPLKLGTTDGLMAEVISGEVKEGERLLIKDKLDK